MARYLIRTWTLTEVETEACTPQEALNSIKNEWVPENYEIFQLKEKYEVWEVERNKNRKTKVMEQAQYYEEDGL